ncbi:MAG: TIR domain-containing protein [Opitutus sp.]|nr:TIR domain-containing protein [Opitutus sp.]
MPESPTSPTAVFVSYAREDTAAALRIAEALRSHGVEVWFDQNELRGGDTWDQKIRRQIADCTLFLPIISTNTQARSKGYFRLEWKLAIEQTHLMLEGVPFLAPVVIDDTSESGAAVPAEFMRVQWTRLPGALPTTQFVEQVKRLLAAPADVPVVGRGRRTAPSSASSTAAGSGDPALQSKRRLPGWAWAALAGVVIGVVGFFATRKSAPASVAVEPKTQTSRPMDLAAAKSTALDPHRLAVLPLDNFSPDTKDEYLAGGLTEELTSSLSKISGLEVIARTSSERAKKSGKSFSEIGAELRVGTLLEGSVRKAGEQLRITVQLIDVASQRHLWSQDYDTEFKDIFKMQRDVAERVAAALKITLLSAGKPSLEKKATENPEAHRLYLLGRFHFAKNTAEGWTNAQRFFTEAIKADPGYALAYCGLADNLGYQPGVMSGKEAWTKQKELAQQALALAPNLAEAHFSLGLAQVALFEWEPGQEKMKRAIELNPNLALVYDQYAWVLAMLARFDESIANQKKAIALDPLSPLMACDLGWWLYHARRYDEAIAQARKVLELDGNFAPAHHLLGSCALFKTESAAAIAALQKAKTLDNHPFRDAILGYAYAVAGDRAKAEEILRGFEEMEKQKLRFVAPGWRVMVYLGLGDKAKALDWLDKCYEDIDAACWFLKVDPVNDILRDEPRFKALRKKIGFER